MGLGDRMITQGFLTEYELLLIRSFRRATKAQTHSGGPNFYYAVQGRDQFMREFMEAFRESGTMLTNEIARGGYRDAAGMFERVSRDVEAKLQSHFLRQDKMEQLQFERLARQWKLDVRNLFYEGYLRR